MKFDKNVYFFNLFFNLNLNIYNLFNFKNKKYIYVFVNNIVV